MSKSSVRKRFRLNPMENAREVLQGGFWAAVAQAGWDNMDDVRPCSALIPFEGEYPPWKFRSLHTTGCPSFSLTTGAWGEHSLRCRVRSLLQIAKRLERCCELTERVVGAERVCFSPEQLWVKVELEEDRAKAICRAQSIGGIKVAVDCSYRNKLDWSRSMQQCRNNATRDCCRRLQTERLPRRTVCNSVSSWNLSSYVSTLDTWHPRSVQVTILPNSQSALKTPKKQSCQSGVMDNIGY